LFLRRLRLRFTPLAALPATASAAPAAAFSLGARRLRLLQTARLARRALLWPGRVLMLSGSASTAALASALLLLRAGVRPRRTGAAAPLVAALAGHALLELLHLSVHETAPLRILTVAESVVAAVGTPLPAFGIRLFAGRAKNALG